MAISSTFYDTSAGVPASLVTEVKWAKAHPHIGSSEYGVAEVGDFKITAHPSTPFAVNAAAGKAWGWGVLDESDQVQTVVCDAPSSGFRWDLICIRRDWTPVTGGPTIITKVQGGTSQEIPAGRQANPGVTDDQPLALVQWTAGQTQPTKLIDLRVWAGNGGMFANDDLVRTYLSRIGSEVNIKGTVWSKQVGANDTVAWVKVGETGKVPLFGSSSSLVGGTPAAGTQFLVQAGTVINDTDAAGFSRITFPSPFPNGLLSIVLTNGDQNIDRALNQGTLTFSVAGSPWGTGNKTDVVYAVAKPSGMAAGLRHRVNYVAIGW